MAFIGNTNTTQAFTPAIDYFSGNASTTAFTLSRPVASVAQVQVVVNNVAQNPSSAYTVSGNTITFTSAPSSGTNNIYVYYTSPITQVVALPQNPQVFGNLQFSSSGARITGDFSNATVANRVIFQTSTVNGTTSIATLPNGTNITSSVLAFGGSDPANAPFTGFNNTATESQILASKTGTGTYLPMTFYTGGSERMRIDTSGNVGIGTSSPGAKLDVANGTIQVTSGYGVFSGAGGANASGFNFGTNLVQAYTSNTERMRIDSSGNVGIGTSSPNKKLEVLSAGEIIRATSTTGANDQLISVKNDSGTANCSTNIFFADRYAASSYASSYIRGTTSGTSALIFATGGTNFTNIYDAGAPIEQARITAAGLFQFNSGYGSVATAYGCRAWVNFNGTGVVAIRASGNVSSITDNGTGNYTVNFSTAMPDTNYSAVGTCGSPSVSHGVVIFVKGTGTVTNTGGVQFGTTTLGAADSDYVLVCLSVFR